MPTIKFIDIAVGMRTEKLADGVKKARGHLGDLKKETGGLDGGFKLLGKAAGILGIALSAKAFVGWVEGSASAMRSTVNFAEQIGTTTKALSELEYAASTKGVGGDEVRSALAGMVRHLQEARTGAGDAAAALSVLGLDARKLAGEDPARAFEEIAAAIAKLPALADRASAAELLLGDAGRRLVPLFSKGAGGLAALSEQARKLGVSVNDVDAKKATKAAEAIALIHKRVEGLGNTLAVALAPFIDSVLTKLTRLTTEGLGAVTVIGTGFEYVGKAAGAVSVVVGALGDVFRTLGREVWAAVNSVVEVLGRVHAAVAAAIALVPKLSASAVGFLESIKRGLVSSFSLGGGLKFKPLLADPGGKAVKALGEIRDGAKAATAAAGGTATALKRVGDGSIALSAKVFELVRSLKEQALGYELSSGRAEILKLKQKGLSDQALAGAKRLNGLLEGRDLVDSLKQPIEVYRDEVRKVQRLFKEGSIGKDTAKLAVGRAHGEFLRASGPRLSGAVEFGSKEARSSILDFQRRGLFDPMRELLKEQTRAHAEVRTTNRILNEIKAQGGAGGNPFGLLSIPF